MYCMRYKSHFIEWTLTNEPLDNVRVFLYYFLFYKLARLHFFICILIFIYSIGFYL